MLQKVVAIVLTVLRMESSEANSWGHLRTMAGSMPQCSGFPGWLLQNDPHIPMWRRPQWRRSYDVSNLRNLTHIPLRWYHHWCRHDDSCQRYVAAAVTVEGHMQYTVGRRRVKVRRQQISETECRDLLMHIPFAWIIVSDVMNDTITSNYTFELIHDPKPIIDM